MSKSSNFCIPLEKFSLQLPFSLRYVCKIYAREKGYVTEMLKQLGWWFLP